MRENLRIAVLGRNMNQVKSGMETFYENNKENISVFQNTEFPIIIMKDGTFLRAESFKINAPGSLRYDQIMVIDNDKLSLFQSKCGEILRFQSECLRDSYISEEFQILEYII